MFRSPSGKRKPLNAPQDEVLPAGTDKTISSQNGINRRQQLSTFHSNCPALGVLSVMIP